MTQRWKCREDFKVHGFRRAHLVGKCSFLVVLHITLHREVMAGNPRNTVVLLEHKLLLRVAAVVRNKGCSGVLNPSTGSPPRLGSATSTERQQEKRTPVLFHCWHMQPNPILSDTSGFKSYNIINGSNPGFIFRKHECLLQIS